MTRQALSWILLSFATPTWAAPKEVDYSRQIKPLLTQHCYACHGGLKQEGGLRLDTGQAIRRGGESGAAIVAGKPDRSPLLARVLSKDADERMPQEGRALRPAEVELLRSWILQGAPSPPGEEPQRDPRRHWSYQPVKRPDVPTVGPSSRAFNPIDAFVGAQQRARQLTPQTTAAKHVLLRRVYLDLIGRPPAPDQMTAFLQDRSPRAYERVVDRLLSSPEYGERWGRHWMDIWRYSDWYGRRASNEIRYSQRHIWRWRDWIVESVNADKGYDRMLAEMLAGDELAPTNSKVLRATGFLGRNWYKFDRDAWLFETIEQTSLGVLGMTLRCARCHDHKFDPISQNDYYRFRAFFEPHAFRTDPVTANPARETDNGKSKVLKDGLSRAYDSELVRPTYRYMRGDSRSPDKSHPLTAGVPAAFGVPAGSIDEIKLPLPAYYPALDPKRIARTRKSLRDQIQTAERQHKLSKAAVQQLRRQLTQFDLRKPAAPAGAPFLRDEFNGSSLSPRWKVLSGQWQPGDGHLKQTALGSFRTLVAAGTHPRDFRARLVYRSIGKTNLNSVGVSFDFVEGKRDWQAIYAHINSKGSGIHAFHRTGGRDTYPAKANVPLKLESDQPVTIEFAVREALLNIWVNGDLRLVHRMTQARQDGKIAIWVHQGIAHIDSIRVAPLPPSWRLVDSVRPRPSPFGKGQGKADLQAQVTATEFDARVAAWDVEIAKAEQSAYESRRLADRAKFQLDGNSAKALAVKAAAAEHARDLLKAEKSVAQSGYQLQLVDPKVNAQTHAKRTKAKAAAEAVLAKLRRASSVDKTSYQPLGKSFPAKSTGRRLALARWLADRRNPRTSRVAVNHIWLRHFGQALVTSVSDFGVRGSDPSHPQLLDWLSAELMDNGWKMKRLHRLIVTSNTYRMSSSTANRPREVRLDAGNRFLWRMNTRRMEAEVVRDSMLAIPGHLDSAMGGPDLADKLGQTSRRRSLYFRTTPDNKMEWLDLFDLANPNQCYQRTVSVVPQQALAMTNSRLAQRQARLLARKIDNQLSATRSQASNRSFVETAFDFVLNRPARRDEMVACLAFLSEQSKLLQTPKKLTPYPAAGANALPPSNDPKLRARENLIQVLFNHHDFITIR